MSSAEAAAVGELPGAAVGERGAGGERVERRRTELAGDGVRWVAPAEVPAQPWPDERADAHREPRDAGPRAPEPQAATARSLAQRRRRRQTRPLRGGGALVAVPVGVPHRGEAPVAEPAPRAPRRGRCGRLLPPAAALHDPGEPGGGPVPPLLAASVPALLLRSVAEERGEHGEPAAAPPPPEPDVALLEPRAPASAVRGSHLRRPEEEQAARRAGPRRRRWRRGTR